MIDKISTSAKLYLLVLITTSVIIATGVYTIQKLKMMKQITETIYTDRLVPLNQLANVRFTYSTNLQLMISRLKNHQLSVPEAIRAIEHSQKTIQDNWEKYQLTYLTTREADLIREVNVLMPGTDSVFMTLKGIMRQKNVSALDSFMVSELYQRVGPIVSKVTELMDLQLTVSSEKNRNSEMIYRSSSKKLLVFTLLLLAISIPLSLYLISNVRNLIKDLDNSNKLISASKLRIIQSEEKFRNVFNHSLVGLSFKDLEGNFQGNEAYASMLGYSKGELSEKKWYDLTHPEDLPTSLKLTNELIAGKIESTKEEKRYVHKDGSVVWAETSCKLQRDSNGEAQFIIAAINNITERKRADIKLQESEEKFRILFEQAGVGVAQVETGTGKFVRINNKYANILGYTREEMLNFDFHSITHPEDLHLHEDVTKSLLNDEINGFTIEKRYLRKGGSVVWVELSVSPMWKKQGKRDYFISVVSDITMRKQAELLAIENEELQAGKQKAELSAQLSKEFSEKLNKAKERAEENDALKTAFLQNISHEVRTPLNAIMGFSNMIKDPALSREKIDYFSSIILNSSNQLLSIITDVLTISSLQTKQEKLNLDHICINELLRDQHAILKMQSSKPAVELHVVTTLPDSLSKIYADKTKITQIITNLVSNSLKFTREGSVEFGYHVKENKLQFYVRDTGIGISPEKQGLIFERFRQADLSISKIYGGTGLGLSISKGFVELMGGEIWVESVPDKGATFYFTIPHKSNGYNDKIPNANVHSSEKELSILIAEDVEFNFLLLEELFRETNCSILRAKNGLEAVEIAKNNASISAVLMDIKMPGMDGYTAAGLIKELYPDLPIIAQSGFPPDPQKEALNNFPFKHYLSKPINKNELFLVLGKHINIASVQC